MCAAQFGIVVDEVLFDNEGRPGAQGRPAGK